MQGVMGRGEGKIATVQWHLDSWKFPYNIMVANNTVLFLPVYIILSMFIAYSVYHRMSKCQLFPSHQALIYIIILFNFFNLS